MTDAARYVQVVEWSEEDGAFVGQCPGIIGPCCHGSDEVEVYRELCGIVEEWIEIARREGRPLPPATAGTGVARRIAYSAMQRTPDEVRALSDIVIQRSVVDKPECQAAWEVIGNGGLRYLPQRPIPPDRGDWIGGRT